MPLVWEAPAGRSLNQVFWESCATTTGIVVFLAVAKWTAVGSLLLAGAFWAEIWQFETVVRHLVGIGAAVSALQALASSKHYQVTANFCAMILLYNPLQPILSLTGDWQRALVVASGVPFILSLAWRGRKVTR